MTRFIYVNGFYRLYGQAEIHVEDRGFQFADGVYEVCEVLDGCLVDERRHMRRLSRSLSELGIEPPMSMRALGTLMRETVRRNRVDFGIVYLQITRGIARREFTYPKPGIQGSVICYARRLSKAALEAKAARGLKIITVPDIRWRRPDIKTIGLLPNAMAKQTAKDAGADDAWFVDEEGYITEGASSNAWIISRDRRIMTRPADSRILGGITREVLLALLERSSYIYEEKAFTVAEAKAATEAFLTSASALVMPVVNIDGKPIGDGKPGRVTQQLRQLFHNYT